MKSSPSQPPLDTSQIHLKERAPGCKVCLISVRLAELWEMLLGCGKQRGALGRVSAFATGCEEGVPTL